MQNTSKLTRRKFTTVIAAGTTLAGCIGSDPERPGVLDQEDISFQSNSSEMIEFSNIENNGDRGLMISTNDTMQDGEAISETSVTVPQVSQSIFYILADVDQMDDDAEIEIRAMEDESTYRTAYIGNEYRTQDRGVLATETGTGFELRTPFPQLPASENTDELESIQKIQFRVNDGDFKGKIWQLAFLLKDKTVLII